MYKKFLYILGALSISSYASNSFNVECQSKHFPESNLYWIAPGAQCKVNFDGKSVPLTLSEGVNEILISYSEDGTFFFPEVQGKFVFTIHDDYGRKIYEENNNYYMTIVPKKYKNSDVPSNWNRDQNNTFTLQPKVNRPVVLSMDRNDGYRVSSSQLSVGIIDGERVSTANFNFPELTEQQHKQSSSNYKSCWYVANKEVFFRDSHFYIIRQRSNECGLKYQSWVEVLSFDLSGKPNLNLGTKGIALLKYSSGTVAQSMIDTDLISDESGIPVALIIQDSRISARKSIDVVDLSTGAVKVQTLINEKTCKMKYREAFPQADDYDVTYYSGCAYIKYNMVVYDFKAGPTGTLIGTYISNNREYILYDLKKNSFRWVKYSSETNTSNH